MRSNTYSHAGEYAEFFHSAVTSAADAMKPKRLITNIFRDKRDQRSFSSKQQPRFTPADLLGLGQGAAPCHFAC